MKFGVPQVIESHREEARTVKRSFIHRFSSKYERRLLALCKNNPNNNSGINKQNKDAVRLLLKKYNKNSEFIEELEKAILSECSKTKCIPFTNTPDNRLQVSHRRGLPLVVYCRLWRWPDLQSHHQIKAIQTCDNHVRATSACSKTVCINPYHYVRNPPANIEPVLVPCSQLPPDLSTSFEDSDPATKHNYRRIMQTTTITGETVRSILSPATLCPAQPPAPRPQVVARPYQFRRNRFSPQPRAMHEQNYMNQQVSYEPHRYTGYNQQGPPHYEQPQLQHQHHQQQQQQQQIQLQPQQNYPVNYDNSYATQQTHISPSPTYLQQPLVHPQSYEANNSPQQEQYQPQDNYVNQEQYVQSEHMQLDYPQQVSMSAGFPNAGYYEPVAGPSQTYTPQPAQKPTQITFHEIPYTERHCWCKIAYHEFDRQVGASFESSSFTVTVDGYTRPDCSDRFCVGGLSNPKRDDCSEGIRRRIGAGIKLTYVDGEVYLESLCESSIFVASPMLSDEVTKIVAGQTVKVFSNPEFSKLLSASVANGFEEVYRLPSYCKFRVSFIKGWGRYYKRSSIAHTPCWIEVLIKGPLHWVDEVLRQMKPPQGCGSTS